MVTHEELLQDFSRVRALVLQRYEWFIHVTSHLKYEAIVANGLLPHSDAPPPDEVVSILGEGARNILCLHPLGAVLHPAGLSDPPLVSFAVKGENMPRRLGLDWSYVWPMVGGYMKHYEMDQLVPKVLHELGSVVSYDPIPPSAIRVFCKGSRPSNPLTWVPLPDSSRTSVVAHD